MKMYNITRVSCMTLIRVALVVLLSFTSLCCMIFESDDECSGETMQCDEIGSADMCDTIPGCRISSECRPIWPKDPCAADRSLGAESTCNAKPGCLWKPAILSSDCVSVTHECAQYNDYESCSSDRNCQWIALCEGTALDCSEIRDKTTCNEVFGCFWGF